MNASPVMTLAVGGQVDGNLYTYVENNVQPELEKIKSVGEVSLAGGQKEYVSVCLDPEKMAQYNFKPFYDRTAGRRSGFRYSCR